MQQAQITKAIATHIVNEIVSRTYPGDKTPKTLEEVRQIISDNDPQDMGLTLYPKGNLRVEHYHPTDDEWDNAWNCAMGMIGRGDVI